VAAYADDSTLLDARARYFADNGFAADGGYADDWVIVKLGPVPFPVPNTAGRRAAVPCHDLHHVATGFATDLVGEGEIGAWEIGSGCTQVRAALVLNLLVMWPVLFLAPGRLFRAFVWGRHTRNLYDARVDAHLLSQTVGALRARLGLEAPPPAPTPADRWAFAGWLAAVVAPQLAILALLVGVPAWLLAG
jgi:hypothetical protein